MSKIKFQIICVPCGTPIRYDAEVYQSTGFMEWTCWECGAEAVTNNLLDSIISLKDGSEEECL